MSRRNKCNLKIGVYVGQTDLNKVKIDIKRRYAVFFNQIVDSDMDVIALYVFRVSSYFIC